MSKIFSDKLKIEGKKLHSFFDSLSEELNNLSTSIEIKDYIDNLFNQHNLTPAFKGLYGFPNSSCISINNVVLHGVVAEYTLKPDDIIKIDLGATVDKMNLDCARTFVYKSSNSDSIQQKLKKCAESAFNEALTVVKSGANVSEISKKIYKVITDNGFYPVREYVGHGIGKELHQQPDIPCFYNPRYPDYQLKEGEYICVEPMVLQNEGKTIVLDDGFSVASVKYCLSSHYEDTILVTKNGYELIT